jgi:hypothetical protein
MTTTRQALAERITAYLAGGGLFNPEMADHDAVRDLLIDCRAALEASVEPATRQAQEGPSKALGELLMARDRASYPQGWNDALNAFEKVLDKHTSIVIHY